MGNNFREQVFKSLNLKETEELLDIWKKNNRFEWSEVAFDVIQEILTSRIGDVPPQDKPTYEPAASSVYREINFNSDPNQTNSIAVDGVRPVSSYIERPSLSERIGEKIITLEKKYLKKHNGLESKYSRVGIFITFLGTTILAIFIGLALYWTGTIIGFHIPFIFPMLTSVLIALPILDMGKNLGHCRKLSLAISIPVFASIVVWVIEHFVGSLLFHTDNSTPFTIIKFGGVVLPIIFALNKFWTTVYWIVELIILIVFTAMINSNYPFQSYCEKCNAWHKLKTLIIGTDTKLEQAKNAIKANDAHALIEVLSDEQGENFIRLEIEFCPKCYSDGARLVVVNSAENSTWEEEIVWEGMLEPKCVQELIQNAV